MPSSGSPPRVRGKPDVNAFPRLDDRITPARAGKTDRPAGRIPLSRDHPRACGENGTIQIENDAITGSPPRVRGKLHERRQIAQRRRITPARAGKTPRWKSQGFLSWDHPRACGENMQKNPYMIRYKGSPPRVRGKLSKWGTYAAAGRITPARAGKTRRLTNSRGRRGDHPRACGENPSPSRVFICNPGSPPRVRGKPPSAVKVFMPGGITPARAGKTFSHSISGKSSQDHPRACGENITRGAGAMDVFGSPPRVRGKQSH